MTGPPRSQHPTRCANCGATLYEGAEWCNLCFSPVAPVAPVASVAPVAPVAPSAQEPERTPAPPTAAADATTAVDTGPAPPSGSAMWPCPICGERNAIELDACGTCGTAFAALMRKGTEAPRIDPATAGRWSLVFPGLGHAKAGRGVDGLARGVLFTILLLVTGLLLVSGAHNGLVRTELLLFAAGTVAVYALSAMEARRIAEGGEPIVSSRALLWTTVGVLMTSVVLIALVIGTTPRR
jgi:hypothetical protein